MKVGYFADGPWSHTTIDMLNNHKEIEILFIVPRYETQDPILRDWAKKLKIPFIVESNVNNITFINYLKNFNADLFISMSFNQILFSDILSIPKIGFINCHAGKLPFYRGRNPLNWALINDEKDFGITVHYIDEGIDSGNIVLQKKKNIHMDFPKPFDSMIETNNIYKSLIDDFLKNLDNIIKGSGV